MRDFAALAIHPDDEAQNVFVRYKEENLPSLQDFNKWIAEHESRGCIVAGADVPSDCQDETAKLLLMMKALKNLARVMRAE